VLAWSSDIWEARSFDVSLVRCGGLIDFLVGYVGAYDWMEIAEEDVDEEDEIDISFPRPSCLVTDCDVMSVPV
jgi:hypothetical protein